MVSCRCLSPALRLVAQSRHTSPAPLVRPIRRLVSTSSTSGYSQSSALRAGLYVTAFAVSTGLFSIYYFDARSALHRYLLTPALRHALSAENGHKVAVKVLRSGLGPKDPVKDGEILKTELWGVEISNPLGLAAGFDKNGEAIDGLFDLGFSWVEIGSVTPKPQSGNPHPRVFHLPEDEGMINRYGFPSEGQASVLSRLRARLPSWLFSTLFFSDPTHEDSTPRNASLKEGALLAVNLGKNKTSPESSIEDFLSGVRTFGSYADVLVINVSSPNTPGLRGLQNRNSLEELLSGVIHARDELEISKITHSKPKILVKLAPDLDDLQFEEIAEVIRNSGIDGVIVSNTTIQRPRDLISSSKFEIGGLSGRPLKPLSLHAVRTLRTLLPSSIPVIGCGGISSGRDALEFAQNGASMVQIYTHFGYDGVGAPRRIKNELEDELKKVGKSWKEVASEAVERLSWKKENRVEKLIEEAKELDKLLDKLGESIDAKMKGSETATIQARPEPPRQPESAVAAQAKGA